ncbi:MAG: Uma2 family endonuclease [Polyangiaceae bacterium]|nr:Uma2 family endonuclease [Polyangiaceae bacterium]
MGFALQEPYVSYAEYLALEEESPTKHEWFDGEIFDMSGSTPPHSRLATAVASSLTLQLKGKRCSVFNSDLRVRIGQTGLATYPDVSVVCTKLEVDAEDANAATNPTLLVEVLSDSSEAYDRGKKFGHYRRIPSLQEYVLISQHTPLIEVFRKNESGRWELMSEARSGETAPLESVGAVLNVDEVYTDPLAEPAQ